MSKLKTPRDKKIASLLYDRRNVYGENDKASRKNIPLRKQQSHQAERRAANRPLSALPARIEDELADAIESSIVETEIGMHRKGFKKSLDAPLGMFLESRETGDWLKVNRGFHLPNRKPKP